jgi:predicted molibdopterin-dependent oxidoreductase YjgC
VNIHKPSTGVNPLRGQNNVQGACDMGALPNVYPGYQKVDNADAKNKFEKAWVCKLNGLPGLTHIAIFDAVHEDKIKAIYIVGENPILSEANSKHTEAAIKKLEGLNILRKQELVEINPEDAASLRITDGEIIRVISRRGEIKAMAKITDISPPGTISMTFHFAESPTNVITSSALDPVAKTPETKVCAVRLEKSND